MLAVEFLIGHRYGVALYTERVRHTTGATGTRFSLTVVFMTLSVVWVDR